MCTCMHACMHASKQHSLLKIGDPSPSMVLADDEKRPAASEVIRCEFKPQSALFAHMAPLPHAAREQGGGPNWICKHRVLVQYQGHQGGQGQPGLSVTRRKFTSLLREPTRKEATGGFAWVCRACARPATKEEVNRTRSYGQVDVEWLWGM